MLKMTQLAYLARPTGMRPSMYADVRADRMQSTADDRLWAEWLSRYLDHCRRELNARELAALASALDGAVREGALPELARTGERVATVAQPLVAFIATAPSSDARMALGREAAVRLRAAARQS